MIDVQDNWQFFYSLSFIFFFFLFVLFIITIFDKYKNLYSLKKKVTVESIEVVRVIDVQDDFVKSLYCGEGKIYVGCYDRFLRMYPLFFLLFSPLPSSFLYLFCIALSFPFLSTICHDRV